MSNRKYSAALNFFSRWKEKHNKPIIVTEYGADTVAGLHSVNCFPFYFYSYFCLET